jgi:hypothetical protein
MTGPLHSGLRDLRRIAETLMVDTCTITREGTGRGPFNAETGTYAPPERVEVYTGKCRVQIQSMNVAVSNAGDRVGVVQQAEWQGPVIGTEGVAVDDVIRIDVAVNDAALEGRELTVASLHTKSYATSRRLMIREATG